MKTLLIGGLLLLCASPVWACSNFSDCMYLAENGVELPDIISGDSTETVSMGSSPNIRRVLQKPHTDPMQKAIAYKLEEIGNLLNVQINQLADIQKKLDSHTQK